LDVFLRLAVMSLLVSAAFSGAPSQAQENPAFFGTWRFFGDDRLTLTLWPGAFQDSGQPAVKYRVVRDMGTSVLLLKWPLHQKEFVKTPTGKGYSFYLLHLVDDKYLPGYWTLEYWFCSTVESANDRFPVDDFDKLWQVLLTKNRNCELEDGGRKPGEGWSGLNYARKKPAAK